MGVRRVDVRDLHGANGVPRADDCVQPQLSRGVPDEVAGQPVSGVPVSPQQRQRSFHLPGIYYFSPRFLRQAICARRRVKLCAPRAWFCFVVHDCGGLGLVSWAYFCVVLCLVPYLVAWCTVLRGTIVNSKQDQIVLVKIGEYLGLSLCVP